VDVKKIIDAIIELRSRGTTSAEQVAGHLKSTLEAANIQFQTQAVSGHSRGLLLAIILALSVVFLVGVLRRRHRMASISALAIPLLLFLELSAGLHVVTWISFSKSQNIVVQYPVQDATQRVIVGVDLEEPKTTEPDRFTATVSALLFPISLVFVILGIWRAAIYFGKFDFEDAHTIAAVMGAACVIYYALAFGICIQSGLGQREKSDARVDAGALAVAAGLADDLSQRRVSLENTWVTVAFFGDGGSEEFAERIGRRTDHTLPTYFIGCERLGRGGALGMIFDNSTIVKSDQVDRSLVRAMNRATEGITGRPLEIIRDAKTNASAFIEQGIPSIALTTTGPENWSNTGKAPGSDGIDREKLMLALKLLETTLSALDSPTVVGS